MCCVLMCYNKGTTLLLYNDSLYCSLYQECCNKISFYKETFSIKFKFLVTFLLKFLLSYTPSCTVGGNANQYSHYGEQCGDSSRLETELPYNPAIPLLIIHTEETRTERDTCTPMFIAALFTIARTWKQPRCPSADEWIENCGTYTQCNITQPLKRMNLCQFK